MISEALPEPERMLQEKERAFRAACLALSVDPLGATKWLEAFRSDGDVLTVTKAIIEAEGNDDATALAVQVLRDVVLERWELLSPETRAHARDLFWRAAVERTQPFAAAAFAKLWKRANKDLWTVDLLFSPSYLGNIWRGAIATAARAVASEFNSGSHFSRRFPGVHASFETEANCWWQSRCAPLAAEAVSAALFRSDFSDASSSVVLETAVDLADDGMMGDEALVIAACEAIRLSKTGRGLNAGIAVLKSLARKSRALGVAHIALPRLAAAMSQSSDVATCICDLASAAAVASDNLLALGPVSLGHAAAATSALLAEAEKENSAEVDVACDALNKVFPALELWVETPLVVSENDYAACRDYCGLVYLRYAGAYVALRRRRLKFQVDLYDVVEAEEAEGRALVAAVGRRAASSTFSEIAKTLRDRDQKAQGDEDLATLILLATDLATNVVDLSCAFDEEGPPELPTDCPPALRENLLDAIFDILKHDITDGSRFGGSPVVAGALAAFIARWLAGISNISNDSSTRTRLSLTIAATNAWLLRWPRDHVVLCGMTKIILYLARKPVLAADVFDTSVDSVLELFRIVALEGDTIFLVAAIAGALTDLGLVLLVQGRGPADLVDRAIEDPLCRAIGQSRDPLGVVDVVAAICRADAVQRLPSQDRAAAAAIPARIAANILQALPLDDAAVARGALAAFRDLVNRQLPYAQAEVRLNVLAAAPAFVAATLASSSGSGVFDDDVVASLALVLDFVDSLLAIDGTETQVAAAILRDTVLPSLRPHLELLRSYEDLPVRVFAALHSLALAGAAHTIPDLGLLLAVGLGLPHADAKSAAEAALGYLALNRGTAPIDWSQSLAALLKPLLADTAEPKSANDAADTAFSLIHALCATENSPDILLLEALFQKKAAPSDATFSAQNHDRFLLDLRRLFDVAVAHDVLNNPKNRRNRKAFQLDFLAFLTAARSYIVPS